MIDYRLRRPASGKPKKAETAARVAEIVGGSLREIRRRQGHSLDTLAAASGVSRAMLGQIETGKSIPTITVLWKIAAALDVAFGGVDHRSDVAPYSVTRRIGSYEPWFRHLSSRGRSSIRVRDARFALEEFRIGPGHERSVRSAQEQRTRQPRGVSGAIEDTIGKRTGH